MGVKTYSDSTVSDNHVFRRKAGRCIIESRPVFSPDGESVLLIVENVVRVYNIQTGDCARSLETEAPVEELVAVDFPQNENYNLIGCSNKGCVTTWPWENGGVLREVNLQIPGEYTIETFNLLDSNECFITAARPSTQTLHLATYSIKTGHLLYQYNDIKPQNEGMVRVALGVYNGEKFAAITDGSKNLYIQNLVKPHLKSVIPNHNHIRITAVAAHHTDSSIAITDTLGRVTIIRGNFYNKHVSRETMHWHFVPPFAVCFSMQGSYLFSGGVEKVLVKWTIGGLASRANEKMFIPRLPGIIRHVSASDAHIAISLSNNSVVIANAQMRIVSTILECGGLSPYTRSLGTSMIYHKPLEALVIGGRVGHLQLYSTNSDKVLYNIDITEMNNIPPERYNVMPTETEVTCAAISSSGTCLVTSEYRNDNTSYPEERLKFWAYQSKSTSSFKLNTCVNLSHGGCNVVSLALNNKGEFCVSAGTDQKFRIWKKEYSQSKRKQFSWMCLTACYYSSGVAQFLSSKILNEYRVDSSISSDTDLSGIKISGKDDLIYKLYNVHKSMFDSGDVGVKNDDFSMGGVAVSQDGWLIAAWFGSKLTLWDTHQCNMRTSLSHPALRPRGIHVKFGNNDAAPYLVCTTEQCLAVWSLLSLTVKWLVPLNPTSLAADPFSNKMAVTTTGNDVFVFTPHSSIPVLTKKRLLDPATGVFRQCTFGSSKGDDVRLFLMRNNSEIYSIEPEQSEDGRLEVISKKNLPLSNFSALLAEQRLSEVQPAQAGEVTQTDTSALAGSAMAQFLSAAPHMVPSVSLICTSFLQHISGEEQTKDTDSPNEEPMVIDSSSSDEEDLETSMLNGPYAPKTTELWMPDYTQINEKRLNKVLEEPFLDLGTISTVFGVK